MHSYLKTSVCTNPWAEHPSLAGPCAGVRCNSAQRNRTTWGRLGEDANFRSYFILYLSDLCLQIIQYYVMYVSSLFILALVFCPAWAAPVNFLGQSLGTHLKHSKLPHLRGCLVLLLADLGSCTGEKWPGVGEAVWGQNNLTKQL